MRDVMKLIDDKLEKMSAEFANRFLELKTIGFGSERRKLHAELTTNLDQRDALLLLRDDIINERLR